MAQKSDFDALVTRLNTATNAIAAKLAAARTALAAALADAGVPADQEAAALTDIDNAVKALEAMGSDSGNPIPPDQV